VNPGAIPVGDFWAPGDGCLFDLFAGQAMAALMVRPEFNPDSTANLFETAAVAYQMAAAMMRERESL
jgi:hypothetical protein